MADQSKDSQHSSNITEQERYFSSHALNEFKQRRYDSCSNMLRKLADLRPNDPRVLVNRAVVDYYQSGLCKTDEFRKQLAIAKKQVSINLTGLRGPTPKVSFVKFKRYCYGLIKKIKVSKVSSFRSILSRNPFKRCSPLLQRGR